MKKFLLLPLVSLTLLTACAPRSNSSIENSVSSNSQATISASSLPVSVASSSTKSWSEKTSDGSVSVTASPLSASLYDPDHTSGASESIPVTFSWSNTTQLSTQSLDSSDPTILPVAAMSFVATTASQSNLIVGGNIVIDLTKVLKAGSVYIEGSFASGNVSSYRGTITKKITFYPFGQLPSTLYTETLSLDYSKASYTAPLKVTFQVDDSDYAYGQKNANRPASDAYRSFFQVDLTSETAKTKTIPFSYEKGHHYVLLFLVQLSSKSFRYYEFLSTIGSGDSTRGFNQFVYSYSKNQNALSFVDDGVTLSINVTADYHA